MRIFDLVRWHEWYDTKIAFLFVCMYYSVLYSSNPDVLSEIGEIAGLTLLFCLYASFGYIINSYSDKLADSIANKTNALLFLSNQNAVILIWSIILISLVTVTLLYHDRLSVIFLFSLAFAIAAGYSLSPIRLKERVLFGLITPAIAQRTLPAIIVFHTMFVWNWTALSLCILNTLIGLRYIVVHQITDKEADLKSNVRTVATITGNDFLRKLLIYVIFPIEILFLVIAVYLMSKELHEVGIIGIIYIVWFTLNTLMPGRKNKERLPVLSYHIFSDFYHLLLPLFLSALLVQKDITFLIVFMTTVVWLFSKLWREIRQIIHVLFVYFSAIYYRK